MAGSIHPPDAFRILVTRERAEPLCTLLAQAGLEPVHLPLVSLAPTEAPPPENRPTVVLVTSAAVARFVPDLAGVLGAAEVVAVGKRTEAALRGIGIVPMATGRTGGAEAVDHLVARVTAQGNGAIAWHIGAEALSPALSRALAGVDFSVQRWAVYRNLVPPGAAGNLAEVGPLDVVTLASGSAVQALAALGGLPGALHVVLGPSTAEAAEAAGMTVEGIAASPTAEDLVAAVVAVLAERPA